MKKFKLFYSWQSDLPGSKNRNFIRNCIDKAIDLAEESEAIEAERDEATAGVTGSPNIVTTLFDKIDDCDLFVADISLCFTETQDGKKKSPNPNVMLELGYAVKVLGWERIVCLCNVDYGDEYPFDIAHNRITNYSFEAKSKKEVESELSLIIFKNIRDIRKLKPRAKAGMATHILGSYDTGAHLVAPALSPIDIANQEGFTLHNRELLYKSQQLVSEIEAIFIPPKTVSTGASCMDSVATSQSPLSANVQSVSELFNGTGHPVEWKESDLDKDTIKYWLDIDVSDGFFNLGNMKQILSISEPKFEGTDDEVQKYEKLQRLSYMLLQLQVRTNYLKTFNGMHYIPLAIQNISSVQDKNIRVVVKVNTGEIVEPDAHLIWNEFEGIQGLLCRDDDEEKDVGVICELFAPVEDGFIHVEEVPYDPQKFAPKIPIFTAHGPALPKKDEDDYALELQEFIAKTDGRGYYEFDVDNLRPGECKWLCCGLLIRPIDGAISITYQIHSDHSTGELTSTLEWHEN